jgi:hypothetical protein
MEEKQNAAQPAMADVQVENKEEQVTNQALLKMLQAKQY